MKKHIDTFKDFNVKKLNENSFLDLFKSKNAKLKEIEKKYIGKIVSFKLKTTNSSGIEIPSNVIRLKGIDGFLKDSPPITKDGTLSRKIKSFSYTPSKKIEIVFESLTGEHIILNSGYGSIVYLDGTGEYAYMFQVIEPGDLKPIIEDIQTIK